MIHHIRGKIDGTIDGGIVVEANGIGYEVFVPDNSSLYLHKNGEEVKVLTVMIVKDRVLAHNPVAALYTVTSMYSRFKKELKL